MWNVYKRRIEEPDAPCGKVFKRSFLFHLLKFTELERSKIKPATSTEQRPATCSNLKVGDARSDASLVESDRPISDPICR